MHKHLQKSKLDCDYTAAIKAYQRQDATGAIHHHKEVLKELPEETFSPNFGPKRMRIFYAL